MNPPDANGRAPGDGPRTTQCLRCGMPAALDTVQCPSCLLRLGLKAGADGETSATASSAGKFEAAGRVTAIRDLPGYELIEEIGRGGMGVIYRARHEQSGSVVAVKCLLDYHAESSVTVARFRREAAAAAMLRHPNILPVYEVGDTHDGLPFFSMQLATGGSLHRAGGAATNDARSSAMLVHKIAGAVQFAHERGILHRDLKPGNILLDGAGEPFVSDFGLAKWLHEPNGLTRTLLVFGTPGYIAPEQAHGPAAAVGPRADIYSLGAILFELLTGRPPFLGEHALAVLKQAAERRAPSVRLFAPHVDRELETICARCLEREPSARYATAGQLAADLGRWLNGRRITARRVSVATRAWRASRRNLALTAAMIAALLCGGFAAVYAVNNQTLRRVTDENVLATRSLLVLPILDLDSTAIDEQGTRELATSLDGVLNAIGPARVTLAANRIETATARQRDVLQAASAARSRTVIAVTKRRSEKGKRLSIRVLDGATGEQLLLQSVDAPTGHVSAAGWAAAISAELYRVISRSDGAEAALPLDPGMRDPAVRHSIEAGRELMFRQSAPEMNQAITLFEKALLLEPNSARARAFLSSTCTMKAFFTSDDRLLERGEVEARRALELSPQSGDAHRALAGVLFQRGAMHEALHELRETAEICGVDDNLAAFSGMILDNIGASERAIHWYQLSLAITTRAPAVHAMLADAWTKLHEDEKALQFYRRAAELQPRMPHPSVGIARIHMLRGEFEAARHSNPAEDAGRDHGFSGQIGAQIEFFARDFARAEELYARLSKAESDGGGWFFGAMNFDGARGRCLQELGRADEARELLLRSLDVQRRRLERQSRHPAALYRVAAIESSLGSTESAIQHLRAAVDAGWSDYRSLQMDPRFDGVRHLSSYRDLLERLMGAAAEQRTALASL